MEPRDDATAPRDAEPSDAALISRVREGDDAACRMLCERHLPAARGLAGHLAGHDAAEDAVQDAFAKVLSVLRRGGVPGSGFRPYLLTAVRRTVHDRQRADRHDIDTADTDTDTDTDGIEAYGAGEPFGDPAAEELERSMVARAFRSLPERWQTVLWHTEVEDGRPADVAPILGLTANDAAALAYRARDGLRQAYLQMHLDGLDTGDACRPVLDKLGAYVRDALPGRDSRRVERHLDGCKRCKGLYRELSQVDTALRDVIGPLVLGSASTAYLASRGGFFLWVRHLPRRRRVLAGAAVTVAGAMAFGLMLVSDDQPAPEPRTPPAAAEPVAPPAARPPAAKPPTLKPPALKPPAARAPVPEPLAKRHASVRPAGAEPRARPPHPAPKPRVRPPQVKKPSKPDPAPPRPPIEHPGGLLIHIELWVPLLSAEVRVHLGIDTPICEFRSIRHRAAS
ncbi:sigma-70 family RNA polymerase sigma factor [Actinomadura mexicana]|uniref:RNA polymerase sigma factor, sigma-70 family n=1 Tax=Actinomadura mexicana TaxID=134959 RepID=A0A239G5S8_9ACTN|nr:sigma-70 family RNA polymerase sigma factor [Actinomadura mexicana]SNS64499.1 RNA polymerase sigma factor, sigma-70 family [Actinomadura mexicana]